MVFGRGKSNKKDDKKQVTDDPNEPAWLLEEYDEKHRQETEPLFGTGNISLQDPEIKEDKTTIDVTSEPIDNKGKEKNDNTKDYGSLNDSNNEIDDDSTKEKVVLPSGDVLKLPKQASIKSGNKVRPKIVGPESLKPHKPGQNPCLWLFHLLEGISTISAVCLLLTQLLPFILVKFSDIPKRIGILSTALKVYISLFCILFIITETSIPPLPVIKNSVLLQTYISRGLLYSFLGLICVEEAYSEHIKDIVESGHDEFHIGWASIFMEVSSWLMLGCGFIYMIMGLCCMKRLRDRMKQNEINAWEQYRIDLKEWKEKYGGSSTTGIGGLGAGLNV